jgi:hypothetical protein
MYVPLSFSRDFWWEEQPMYEAGHRTYTSSRLEPAGHRSSQPKAIRPNMYFTTNLIVDGALGTAFVSAILVLSKALGLKLNATSCAMARAYKLGSVCLSIALATPSR